MKFCQISFQSRSNFEIGTSLERDSSHEIVNKAPMKTHLKEFLMMLKEKCSMTDAEWEERQKTRQLEMEAVSKALAVLSTDDAHSRNN